MVSVVMPSYNSDKEMLEEAVKSILNQTYHNLELIIIDDGSETTVEEVLNVIDDRIHIVRNDVNSGIIYSLNRGLDLAHGEYIARMDADDIADEKRVQLEVDYLNNNGRIDVVSTYARTFGMRNTLYKSETTPEGVMAELLWKNPIIHPTVMLRSSLVTNEFAKYSESSKSEDFDLWSRVVFKYKKNIAVIPKPLLNYRIHEKQITKTKSEHLKNDEKRIVLENMNAVGIKLAVTEYELYTKARNEEITTWREMKKLLMVFCKVLEQIQYRGLRRVLIKRYSKELIKCMIKCLRKSLYDKF